MIRSLVDRTARQVVDEMRALRMLREPRINGDLPRPEIVIRPRLDLAAELGVTVASISQTIRIATLGDLPQNAAKFSLADRQIPIRVSLIESARRDLTTLENLPVPTAVGRQRAAQGRRRHQLRSRAGAHAPLQPEPPIVDRSGSQGRASWARDCRRSMRCRRSRTCREGVRKVEIGNAEMMRELFANFGIAM